jgi:uncharacterized membrane protein
MDKNRLEAFSDGVLAIIITIMVLELKVPHGSTLDDLRPLLPVFLSYLLSFVYVGIYWNNHHHLIKAVRKVNGGIMWSNLHLLFWLSLFPFATGWMGENHFKVLPTALYGMVLFLAACAYYILQQRVLAGHAPGSPLVAAFGRDFKGKGSIALYVVAIVCAPTVHPLAACAIYVAVALMWLIPDLRIERAVAAANPPQS